MDLFVITGITKGLGYSINNILKKENKYTLSISRNIEVSQEYNNRVIECDLSNISQIIDLNRKFSEAITDNITRIVFINNAGAIDPIYKVGEDIDYENIVKHINVNYIAPIIITNEIMKIMNKDCRLEIINITTGAAERPLAKWALYSSSKKATKTYFETIKLEDERINVLNYDPGVMDTSMQGYIRKSNFPLVGKFREYSEEKMLKSPDEVAKDIMKRYIQTL
ncbi:SDR family NAD(P)-dependent oxidoreductase [Lysinibacillus xylanilyticus]|uniref:SDR family NAD(P)-dependent oxidoreductase n=1 Tax=Lysinibacillus xylanilyticus TaxID=582475 RepID=UPI003D082A9C